MRHPISFAPLAAALVFSFGLLVGCGGGVDENTDTEKPNEKPDEEIRCDEDTCAALEAPACMKAVCNDGSLPGKAGECVMVPLADGAACDDGDLCTDGDTCSEGVCTSGTPMDCSERNTACAVGVCDPREGSCTTKPANEGGSCDDGNACTVGDSCVEGSCIAGEPLDCSSLDDACLVGVCDSSTGACTATLVADGTSCEDGDPCSVGDTCAAGVCSSGLPKDCSSLNAECTVGVCDQVTGSCEPQAAQAGTSCDDGNLCTIGDSCLGGTCRGVPRNCSSLDSACSAGACNPADGTCGIVPRNNGTPCDAIDLCAISGVCMDGACVGGERVDCSHMNSDCMAGVCDSLDGTCKSVPANAGGHCASMDSDCTSGVCDVDGSCKSVPANEGGPCFDGGDACTVATTCTAGVCGGGQPPACSMTADGCCPSACSPANDADCSSCPGQEIAGNCVYIPSTATVANQATARAACNALGAGWDLCAPSVLCQSATLSYLNSAGCGCGGGPATCACSGTVNIYMHVNEPNGRSHYARDPALIPSCGSSTGCTVATTATCGTPLCCRSL